MRRGRLLCELAIASSQYPKDLACGPLASANGHVKPNKASHHLVAERRARDVELKATIANLGPGCGVDATNERQRFVTRRHLRPATERREVVLTNDRITRQTHQGKVEGLNHMPGVASGNRIGRRPVRDLVAIRPTRRIETSAEVGRNDIDLLRGDLGPKAGIEHALHPFDRRVVRHLPGWQIERQHLVRGMDTSISATRHHDLWFVANRRAKHTLDLTNHGAHARIRRQTTEVCAVVGDEEADARNRTRRSGF